MYKNQPQNLQNIARELSVSHLVEGSVRKAGNRVRIPAQLIDGKTGGHIWAEKYDRELTDIFEVQDEITAEITSALKVVLQPEDRRSAVNSHTHDLNVYDLFLQGRRQQHMFFKPSLKLAIQLFRQATSIDRNYARAYCGIADSSAFLYQFFNKTRDLLDDINENSAKALALAPDMAEVQASRGYAYISNDDYTNADKSFEKAVQLDPNLYEAHYYWGRAHMSSGELKRSCQTLLQRTGCIPAR
jgi:adenylate cyclase